MYKGIVFVFASGLATAFGLSGCGSRTGDGGERAPAVVVQKDVFQPQLFLVQERGTTELQLVAQVDLQDRLDFRSSSQIKSHVQCGPFVAERNFTGPAVTPLAQLLPEETLTHDLANQTENCTLHFELTNRVGSVWIFSHHPVVLKESRAPLLRIGRDDGTEVALNVAGALPMDGVRVRGSVRGEAQLVCEDAVFQGGAFDHVLDFTHFDFAQPQLREAQAPRRMAERRYGRCRAVVRRDGQVLAFSRVHAVQFPRQPVTVADYPLPSDAAELDRLRAGKPITLRAFDLVNSEPFPRRLLLRGARFQVVSTFYRAFQPEIPVDRSPFPAPFGFLDVPGQPREAATREVVIPAGGRLHLTLYFEAQARLHCKAIASIQMSPPLRGVTLDVTEPVWAIEVEEDHATTIQHLNVGQGVSRMIAPAPFATEAFGAPVHECGWTG